MDAVPGEQKIAAVDGGQRQMQRVAGGTLWHQFVPLAGADDFADARSFAQHRQVAKKMERFFALGGRIGGAVQFLQDGETGEKFVVVAMFVPPFPRPVMAGKTFNILSRFVGETWNRCLDVNFTGHFI